MVKTDRHKALQDFLKVAGCGAATLLLILDSKTSAQAVSAGIRLCLQTVIPSLFPLMVVSRVLMNTSLPRRFGAAAGRFMPIMFAQPPDSAICLLLGLIGGYPVGAQAVAIAYRKGSITKEEGERLLAFCSNAGPAFIFGMLGGLFSSLSAALTLYVIHIFSAFLVGIITKPHHNSRHFRNKNPIISSDGANTALAQSIRSMSAICGYIILFQIGIAFIDKYAGIPQPFKTGLIGFLELSSGCVQLRAVESIGIQYCLASAFVSFGGICVGMQTKAVLESSGLSGKYYYFGKLLQSVIAVLLTWAVIVFLPGLLPRDNAALYLPNHQGLFASTLGVVITFGLFIVIWCIVLGKKAGKAVQHRV